MSSKNLAVWLSRLLIDPQAEPAGDDFATAYLPTGLKNCCFAISRVRMDIGPKTLAEGRNSRRETRQFAKTPILGPCVKRLGMSSYLLALNGWGLYAYGRLGNMRL
jgi:hypothetical protein